MISKNKTKEFLYLMAMQAQIRYFHSGRYRFGLLRLISLLLLIYIGLFTASIAAEKKEPLRLIRADKLEQLHRADFFRYVVATKGSKILTADSLIYFNE